jgi:hypothetical protein
MKSRWLVLAIFFSAKAASAAPCCGATASIPSMITGDDRIQASMTLSNSFVAADALPQGGTSPRLSSDSEQGQTLRFDFAFLLSDRWQLGGTLPLTRRWRSNTSSVSESTGLGDSSLLLGYEAIPDWTYSVWRPKVLLFLSGTFPTGPSLYDSTLPFRIDSRGRGFFGMSCGLVATKSWGSVDIALLLEGHRFFSRTIGSGTRSVVLNPGWGVSSSANLGWSPGKGNVRLGLGLSASGEEGVGTDGLLVSKGEETRLWSLSAQVGYRVSEEASLIGLLSDQTLLGASQNTALSRTVSVLFQKRWGRK